MKYKCPICGCEEHFEVKNFKENDKKEYQGLVRIEVEGWDGANSYVTKSNFKSYVCKKCGHVELFMDVDLIQKSQNQINDEVKQLKQKIQEIEDSKSNLLKQREESLKRLNELENILKDDNVTVATHKNAEKEFKELNDKIRQELQCDFSRENSYIEEYNQIIERIINESGVIVE